MGSGMSREAWLKERHERNQLLKAPDPFVGMQSAINRDAYVNDTLGGGFYGGTDPRGRCHQHLRRPPDWWRARSALSHAATAAQSTARSKQYDTYAGWASDQGAAFGTAPWASDSAWGQAQGYDDPQRYQQPPAPRTAYPTPQFGGGINTFGGTKGWGNTSRNGQQGGSAAPAARSSSR